MELHSQIISVAIDETVADASHIIEHFDKASREISRANAFINILGTAPAEIELWKQEIMTKITGCNTKLHTEIDAIEPNGKGEEETSELENFLNTRVKKEIANIMHHRREIYAKFDSILQGNLLKTICTCVSVIAIASLEGVYKPQLHSAHKKAFADILSEANTNLSTTIAGSKVCAVLPANLRPVELQQIEDLRYGNVKRIVLNYFWNFKTVCILLFES